jgi:ABC-type bacteriocin/lantibiotic exporter with double-glycine peptidase domain
VIDGDLTIGMLVALQVLLLSFLAPIIRFVNFGQTMQNMKVDVARLNDVLRNPVDPLYKERTGVIEGESKLQGEIEFRNVTFGYSPLAPPLIENLSFTIKPGRRLALVGPSGCGKSTLAKLASGLYRPWQGEVLYDGKPIEEVSADLLYHSMASVDQDIFLFEGSVRENLTLWNEALTDEMLMRAADDAQIHEDIMLREKGYESPLDEGGRNLSGGQRQRLEIARALVYNPTFLIMDEATSALDSETEREISDRMRRRGCSALMVAHRLSTIRDCDEILVLEEGKVVQRGSHETLREEEGAYRTLIEQEGM